MWCDDEDRKGEVESRLGARVLPLIQTAMTRIVSSLFYSMSVAGSLVK